MLTAVREAVLDAWAVLQPVECAGCGEPDRGICDRCRTQLRARVRPREIPGLDVPVFAATDYDGVVRSLLLAGKEEGRTDALRTLAPLLATAIGSAVADLDPTAGPVELAWIPSTRAAIRRRGFDPVLVMIRAARLPCSRVLTVSGTVQQKRLGRDARADAAVGRMRSRGRLDGRRFLLVDDVVTTGATISAAVAAIRLGGGRVCAVCCLGTVTLRYPTRDTGAAGH